MCGGGDLGGSNNKDNDKKKGSGNSAGEKLANAITPNDGFSYKDGRLTADNDSNTYTALSPSRANPNEAYGYQPSRNILVDDNKGKGSFLVPKSETKRYNDGLVMSAVIGGLTGGLGGIAAGIGGNVVRNAVFSGGGDGNKDRRNVSATNTNVGSGILSGRNGSTIQGATGAAGAGMVPGGYTDPSTYTKGVHYGTTNDGGFKGMFQPGGFFAGPEFGSAEERSKYMLEQKRKAVEAGRSMADGSDNNDDRVRQTVTTPMARVGPAGPAMSDMSAAAAQGAFEPIPNPDYDPNDPMSPRFIINPSYAQLLEYQQSQVTKMRGGGMIPGKMFSTDAAFKMRRPAYSEPLKQYGNYLEGEYGDAGFEQKKDNFLEEVNMKERQTFSNSGVLPTGGGISSMLMGQPRPDPRGPMFGMHQGGPGQLGMPEGYDRIQGAFPQQLLRGFAEGGELEQVPQEGIAAVAAPQEGGNEKTDIVDAVRAVKGDMSKEEASVALGKFLATYGEEALKNLVEAVQSGELDDTIERFANGEAGEVNGPGDGSGVDDKVPASLEGQEDVLLADGEYVLRAKTAKALEKMYGGGFLDTINESEDNAPRVIRELAARTA